MMAYDNELRGVLFNEQDRKSNDDDRDYAGNITIRGEEFWLSGYIRISKAGKKFLSLKAKPKADDKPADQRPLREALDDDDISF